MVGLSVRTISDKEISANWNKWRKPVQEVLNDGDNDANLWTVTVDGVLMFSTRDLSEAMRYAKQA